MRRSTCTTTVLVILWEVTVPTRILGRPRAASGCCFWTFSDMALALLFRRLRRLCPGGLLLLVEDGQDARQVPALLAQVGARVERPGGVPDPQVEDVLPQLGCLAGQLVDGQVPQLGGLHRLRSQLGRAADELRGQGQLVR